VPREAENNQVVLRSFRGCPVGKATVATEPLNPSPACARGELVGICCSDVRAIQLSFRKTRAVVHGNEGTPRSHSAVLSRNAPLLIVAVSAPSGCIQSKAEVADALRGSDAAWRHPGTTRSIQVAALVAMIRSRLDAEGSRQQ